MNRVMRLFCQLICIATFLFLTSCGDRGKGEPPQQRHMVIGTADQIKAKRETTHRPSRRLPANVTHQRFRDGKLLADDAPHPFILSSGSLLVEPRKNAVLQVSYHQDVKGTLADVIPSSFIISDPSIVSDVGTHQNSNAALLTLTGRKGNSYITALNARGDAISKFMVLAAEARDDVLVVNDPDIHPILCSSKVEPRFNLVCDYNTATNFDQGHSGPEFSIDAYLKNGTSAKKFVLFDDVSMEKLKSLNISRSTIFNKKAIYFENIDTLFVMDEGSTKVDRMAILGQNPTDPSDREPSNPSLWFNALAIDHVAAQDEFNSYIDFGGTLSASLLRYPDQVDQLTHEVRPGTAGEAQLTGIQLSDGSEHSASEASLPYLRATVPLPIKSHIYEFRKRSSLTEDDKERFKCYIAAEFGYGPKFSLNSFKSIATVSLDGDFNWKDGGADFDVKLKPAVDVGGQIAMQITAGVGLQCTFKLIEVRLAEFGIPIFGNAQILIPIEGKTRFGIDRTARGNAVLITPKFNLGKTGNIFDPGEVGFSYSRKSGMKPESSMQTAFSRKTVGLADGTNLSASHTNSFNAIGIDHQAGIAFGLTLRAKVKAWIFTTEVDADILEAMVGFKTKADYSIDPDHGSFDTSAIENKSGIGVFVEIHPSISVHNKFFHISFNLFDFGGWDWYVYKFDFAEEKKQKFEPSETISSLTFLQCDSRREGRSILTDCNTRIPHSDTREYMYGSQQIKFDYLPVLSGKTFISENDFQYQYIYLDKNTGKPVKSFIPAVIEDNGGKMVVNINKYGVTEVLAESIRSTTTTVHPDKQDVSPSCWIWFRGDEKYRDELQSCL